MSSTDASKEQLLRIFILENYLFTEDQTELDNEQSFLDSGILDSMGILELINFLDESFSISVKGSEMIPDNLDSINKLLVFLEKKTDGIT